MNNLINKFGFRILVLQIFVCMFTFPVLYEKNCTQALAFQLKEDINSHKVRDFIPGDEGDAMNQKIFDSPSYDYRFGQSVSSAGDVNGDGFNDIIIGAPYYSGSTGRAFIYFGGANINTIPDIILTGAGVNNYFGVCVSTAGDVNGDGYSDVIVGASIYNGATGRAYIFFGGSPMNNIADVLMTGEALSNAFSWSVSSAGDVNGDGYCDVIAGAHGYSSSTGRAYIYFGGAFMNKIADVILAGEASNNKFGIAVSSAGDVNGDGYFDVICGAIGYSSFTGRAYIFYGGQIMNNSADVIMTGENTNNDFGASVTNAGDVNGDGYSDVAVGASGPIVGRAYVFHGSTAMNNNADVILNGDLNTRFGTSVSCAGDVNNDGYSDIFVGAENFSSNKGRTYLYLGNVAMDTDADIILTGETASDFFGCSVSSAGDVNGDGYPEFIAGAHNWSKNHGRVYLYDYSMSGEIDHEVTFSGEMSNTSFGLSVSDAGDFNGDGYSDIVVGASQYSSFRGRAYVYFGGIITDNIADLVMTGDTTNNHFGLSVSSAGDVNGDGYTDIIVGAYGYSSSTGRAYIFFGGASPNNVADVIMTGEAGNSRFGISVSEAGDINADGYSDVICGSDGHSAFTGRAYIFNGGSSMNNIADMTLTGEASGNSFGRSVSCAGDINGDGYSDIIVGAYAYSSGTGRAYIYNGGLWMNNSPDVIMTGEAAGDNFGVSVSSAGDVNADAYSDVIIGAYGYSNSGRAYIYKGGTLMNNSPDVLLTGNGGNNFGFTVASAGDINQDGRSDVIIGAYTDASSAGRADIFYGGNNMNDEADISMTGETANSNFGYSISSAGDVNSDGYPDIIAGAYAYSLSSGRAYLFTASAISAKPILNFVRDVPNDQGGFVKLKWSRSSLENAGWGNIHQYLVMRSQPPGINGFEWEQIASLTAINSSFYYHSAGTLYDSSQITNGNTFFQIKAINTSTGELWSSNILSGKSIDNISPPPVTLFLASPHSNNVVLNWDRSSAPDLLNYLLYRSTSPVIDPEIETLFAAVSDSTFTDNSPLQGNYYYFIAAQDIHNNKSQIVSASSPAITLNQILFIEGFYDPSSNLQVADTIFAYLHNSVSPYQQFDSAISVLSANGSVSFKLGNAQSGSYFITVKHRNSIETWSSFPVLMVRGSIVNYDFSTSASQAFGSNLKQVDTAPVRFAVYSGDVTQDRFVDASDIVTVYNDVIIFSSGYISSDLSGDNLADLTDLVIALNNAVIFAQVIKP